jgi:two-component system nitrogen regulation sensor histidine kinase NtrY
LVDNCLQIRNPLFKEKQIEVINAISFKRRTNVDAQQIEQVLINLLTNYMYALKDVRAKQILISAEAKENRTFIEIIDNGNGIEKEIENKIFLPFFTTRNEGTGIGLTLSKNIIEAHDDYIAYKSEYGKRFLRFV